MRTEKFYDNKDVLTVKYFRSIKILVLFVFVITLFVGVNSYAQAKKRTNINFEDQLIRGEVQKPELFYIMQKKQFNFGRLIKLRENFLPEMRKTSEVVPRGVK
jgi:hypothetical protein